MHEKVMFNLEYNNLGMPNPMWMSFFSNVKGRLCLPPQGCEAKSIFYVCHYMRLFLVDISARTIVNFSYFG